MSAAIWAILSLSLAAAPLAAAECQRTTFDGAPFTLCAIDPATETVSLHLNDAEGARLGSFANLRDLADRTGRTVALAMNAGMYHPDRRPVGLYIEDGVEVTPIVTRDGPGNFGLLPNGVLCLTDTAARVIESRRFAEAPPECTYATQSGPMLVIDGALHPRFLPLSDSLNIRNGVGVRADGTLVWAISDAPVNFHHFGRLFRDMAQTPNALFLDGRISRLYAPDIGRGDGIGFPMGPMIAVTVPAD